MQRLLQTASNSITPEVASRQFKSQVEIEAALKLLTSTAAKQLAPSTPSSSSI